MDGDNEWQILFPEISQTAYISPRNNDSVPLSTSNNNDQQENNQVNDEKHNNDSSNIVEVDYISDAYDEEIRHKHKKELSILSDISEDLIVIDHNLFITDQASTSYVDNLIENDEEVEYASMVDTTPKNDVLSRPPIQIMHKDDPKYDPKRIPSSVFERSESLIPAEWSAASNESLFSLNVGNASIGRDQATQISGELHKQQGGLLPKSIQGSESFVIGDLQEMRRIAGLPKLSDDQVASIIGTNSKPTMHEGASKGEVDHKEQKLNIKIALAIEEDKEVMKVIAEKKLKEDKQQKEQNIHSQSISLQSNTSEDSNYSFAFPIFGADMEKNNALAKGSSPTKKQEQQHVESSPVVPSHPVNLVPHVFHLVLIALLAFHVYLVPLVNLVPRVFLAKLARDVSIVVKKKIVLIL